MKPTMTGSDPRWDEFINRLHQAFDISDENLARKCKHNHDHARAILLDMGYEVQGSLGYMRGHGGHCDCLIMYNTASIVDIMRENDDGSEKIPEQETEKGSKEV